MDVLGRKMFSNGGSVFDQNILGRGSGFVPGAGFSPAQRGTQGFVQEGEDIFFVYRDTNGNVIGSELVDLSLSPSGDPEEAFAIQKQNEAKVVGGIVAAPLTLRLPGVRNAGMKMGMGVAAGLPKLLKAIGKGISPVEITKKTTGMAKPGVKGFQPLDPLSPSSYDFKFKPVTAGLTTLGVAGAVTGVDDVPDQTEEEIQQELNKLMQPNVKTVTEPVIQQDAAGADNIDVVEDEVEDEVVDKVVQEEEQTPTPTPAPQQVPLEEKSPAFFGTDKFLSLLRNVGSELIRTGRMSGLATGVANFAIEQEKIKQAEAAQRAELAKLAAEQQNKLQQIAFENSLKGQGPSENMIKTQLTDLNPKMQESYDNMVKTGGTLNLIEDVLVLLDGNATPTTIQTLLEQYGERITNFIGGKSAEEFADLPYREKVDLLLNQIKQTNIRAILGESGRTISNTDREIVDRIVGDIKPGMGAAAIRETLLQNKARLEADYTSHRDAIKGLAINAEQLGTAYLIQNPAIINYLSTGLLPQGQKDRGFTKDEPIYKLRPTGG